MLAKEKVELGDCESETSSIHEESNSLEDLNEYGFDLELFFLCFFVVLIDSILLY